MTGASIWARLGLETTRVPAEIRRAYARQLKRHGPADNVRKLLHTIHTKWPAIGPRPNPRSLAWCETT